VKKNDIEKLKLISLQHCGSRECGVCFRRSTPLVVSTQFIQEMAVLTSKTQSKQNYEHPNIF
jgi:hypothetical protein